MASRVLFACLVSVLCLPACWASPAPINYLYSFASGKYAAAVALNDAGRYAVNNFGPEIPYEVAYISGWPSNEDLGSLGGRITRVGGLNNRGDAIGQSTTADGAYHAFLYSSGRMHDLTVAYGMVSAHAINDRGDITGALGDGTAVKLRHGSLEAFGTPNITAGDINNVGDVLVEHVPPGQGIRTAIYRNGTFTDLPLLGGAHVIGSSINDAGWVAGYAFTSSNHTHAFLWDGAAMTDLTRTATSSAAYGINNLGDVVGSVDNRAFLFRGGELIDLNTLIDPHADLLLTSAIAINNREQILAKACDRTGVFCYATVLLNPIPAVPEPLGAFMLLGGLAALGMDRARRTRRGSMLASPAWPERAHRKC